jgi:hypothetical protein
LVKTVKVVKNIKAGRNALKVGRHAIKVGRNYIKVGINAIKFGRKCIEFMDFYQFLLTFTNFLPICKILIILTLNS